MSFPRYQKYKPSEVEWLGEVPDHWETIQIKRVANIRYGIGEPPKYHDEGTPLIRATNVHLGRLSEEGLVFVNPSEIPVQRIVWLEPGDIVVVRSGAYTGDSAIIPRNYGQCIAGFDMVLKCRDVTSMFMQYALLSNYIKEGQIDLAKMRAAQPHLNSEELGSCWLAKPIEKSEQLAIASFLDHETAKIDALIAEQQRLIELLKEKRQAVISHAVTKGLNPHVRMKDSGVEWLGEVPEHWEIKRGRYLYRERQISPEATDGVVTAFRDGQVTLRTNRRTEGFTFAVLEVGYQRVFEGDLVIHGMDAFAGAIGISESTGKCTSEYSVLVPVSQSFENAYFAKAIRLMALRNYIFVICPAVRERAPRFRFSSFKDVLLPVPPLNEQIEIVRHIEKELKEVHILEQEVDKAIKLLQERRTALISAAVTGQIDVRGGFQPVAA